MAQVKDLDPDNFDETIMDTSPENNRVWIVEFYSDRCPICKGLVPEIKKAAENIMKDFPGQIAVGAVNSRVYHDIAEKHGITSYPWVTSFYQGKKIEDMAGLGGWESVYNWAKKKHSDVWKADSNQVFGCATLEKTAVKVGDLSAGDAVSVVSDESLVSKCIGEKGKTWEGKMKDKRGKFLGTGGKVVEVVRWARPSCCCLSRAFCCLLKSDRTTCWMQDEKKDSVLVEFSSDGTQMWWGALYLKAGGKQDL